MRSDKTKKVAFLGLMFALAMVLSYLESMIPSFIAVPGIKLGLSNIVTMYCLFFVNAPSALLLAVLKAGFVLITRGGTAAILSLAGGIFSVLLMILAKTLKASDGFTSVVGAVAHNLGQLLAAFLLLSTPVIFYYIPVLVISGVIMGVITAMLLKVILPAVSRIVKLKN